MSNLPQVFEYQSRPVRVVMIDNEPWFVAADVCKVLELSDPTMALTRLDPDEKAKFNLGYGSPANVVNEPGLYSLIMTSRKPSAKQFKRWVTHEVLPALRKTGRYEVKMLSNEEKLAESLILAHSIMEERNRLIEEMSPKAIAHDTFIETGGSVSVTTAAAHFGMTAPALTSFLITTGAFRRVKDHGQNRRVPKKAYMNYFTVKQEYAYQCSGEPRYRPKVYITPEGMSWVANKLAERGAEL